MASKYSEISKGSTDPHMCHRLYFSEFSSPYLPYLLAEVRGCNCLVFFIKCLTQRRRLINKCLNKYEWNKKEREVQEEMEQIFVFWKLFMDHLRFLDKKICINSPKQIPFPIYTN